MGRMKGVLIILEEFLGSGELCFRKPRVFFSGITLPSDKVLPMGWSSFMANDLLDFIVFFVIDEIRGWSGEVPSHEFHFCDKEIRGKCGMCCEFSMTVGVRVCR